MNISSDDPILIGYLLSLIDVKWDTDDDRFYTSARMDYNVTANGDKFYVNPVVTLVALPSGIDLEMCTDEESQSACAGLPASITIALPDKQAIEVGKYFQELVNDTEIYLIYKCSEIDKQIEEYVTWKEVTILRDSSIWHQ